MSSEPQAVEAEVMDGAIAPTDELERAKAHLAERLDGIERAKESFESAMDAYSGVRSREQMEALPTKELRSARAGVNAAVKGLDDARKAFKRDFTAPVKAVDARVAEITGPARAQAELMGDVLREREDGWRAERTVALADAYGEYAPALVPVVPLDKLMDRRWLAKSTSERKAVEELQAKVDRVARDWDALKQMRPQMRYYVDAEDVFFKSLNLSAAIAYEKDREARQEAIDAMKAEVDGGAEDGEPPEVDAPAEEPPSAEEPSAPDEPPSRWSLSLEFEGTAAFARRVGSALRALGLSGTIRMIKEES